MLNAQRARRGLQAAQAQPHALQGRPPPRPRHGQRNYFFARLAAAAASFVDRIRRAGYLNGAQALDGGREHRLGHPRLASPRTIMRLWMNSPGHRANILSPSFREIGIGVAFGAPVGRRRRRRQPPTPPDFGAARASSGARPRSSSASRSDAGLSTASRSRDPRRSGRARPPRSPAARPARQLLASTSSGSTPAIVEAAVEAVEHARVDVGRAGHRRRVAEVAGHLLDARVLARLRSVFERRAPGRTRPAPPPPAPCRSRCGSPWR